MKLSKLLLLLSLLFAAGFNTATMPPVHAAPVIQTSVSFGAVVLKDANLRVGPGTTFAVVGGLKAGAIVNITAKSDAGDWYQLDNGQWIAAFLVQQSTTAPTTVVEPTPTPVAEQAQAPATTEISTAASANRSANLRGGPGTSYPVVGGVQTGQVLTIVAKNDAGDWYQLDNGQWIAAFLVNNTPSVVSAPSQASAAPAQPVVEPPTPTPVPQPIAQPAPSSSGGRTGAVCRDGTTSSATGRGACSHHGGVDHWLY